MEETVRLTGGRVALTARRSEFLDLSIRRGRILPFDTPVGKARQYDLTGHLLIPGLINIHDHLEFSLFPRLGRGPYRNASDWAADIYHPGNSPLREHLNVPKRARLFWGGIRNLLSGVTTVAHHNPWEARVFTSRTFPVRVVRTFGWAHSLAFSPDVAELHRRTPLRWPFIIHAAEGTDASARAEISTLDSMKVLDRRTILVHAIAASANDLETLRSRSVSLAWCPSSNLFTIGKTLHPATLHSGLTVALGTDSALTAAGDLIDEMRIARLEGNLSDEELYLLVTTNAARALRLGLGEGEIRERGVADLIAVKDRGQTPAQALVELHPEMIMIRGGTMLFSETFADGFKHRRAHGFSPIHLEGRGRWLIRADITRLYAAAAAALGPEIRLGGRRVCP